MKFAKLFVLFLFASCFVYTAKAQWAPNVNVIVTETNVKTTIEGKLEDGKVIDLAWGHHTANNCFPASAKESFRGKHVIYTTQLPTRGTITLNLKPTADTVKMSLYAYLVGVNNFTSVVPNVHSCIICKSDYGMAARPPKKPNTKTEKPVKPQTPVVISNNRTITLKGVGNQAYHVMIGVAGVGELGLQGAYTLEVLVN
jgi:hypothetical protein